MGFPDGHFYSPVVDIKDAKKRKSTLWADPPRTLPGIDFREDSQRELLKDIAEFAAEFPAKSGLANKDEHRCFEEPNGLFEGLDSRMLYCMLRHRQPKRLIEVGSGHTTLLSAQVNRQHFDGRCEITCVEPYPPKYLAPLPPGVERLIPKRVQEVDLALFETLEAGDILFIDSSHVSKTGSDVNLLYLEVLPRLKPGVLVHAHDIFLPAEYPKAWVMEGRSWNEQYMLQALLTHSNAYQVVFGVAFAAHFLADEVKRAFGKVIGGGSFWFERV